MNRSAPAKPALEPTSEVIRIFEEYLEELEAGGQPSPEDLVARHPELAEPLKACLASLEFLHDAALSLRGSAKPVEKGAAESLAELGRLGDFHILREVGRGGMGVVYEAVQISLGRRVALKVLPFAATLDPKQLQRFKNEAQAAAQLHHTNIVPVFGVGVERGVHYYAMQYIEGQTLAAMIRELRQLTGLKTVDRTDAAGVVAKLASELVSGRWAPARPKSAADQPTGPYAPVAEPRPSGSGTVSPLPHGRGSEETATSPVGALSTERSTKSPAFFRTVAQLGIQAAQALEHAHELGVVHRDIKPANLLVDGRGNLWITDFGLAHCQSQAGLTMTGDLVGTLRYMSPEQALAQRVPVDHRTDIYSLGTTLYELLTLEPTFTGCDRQELLRQIAFEEPKPPRRLNRAVPPELQTIIGKAIEKNPSDRYASAQDFADDLRRFLEDKPIRAKRPTLVQRARKWARRHRPVVWSAAVSAGILLVTAAIAATAAAVWYQRVAHDADQARQNEEATGRAMEITLTDMHTTQGIIAGDQGNPAFAVLWFANAARLARTDPEREYFNRIRVRTWSRLLPTPVRALPHPGQVLTQMNFHPQGGHLLTVSRQEKCIVWDLEQERPLTWACGDESCSCATWSPDGRWLALGSPEGEVKVRSFPGGELLYRVVHRGPIHTLAFSPDGHLLVLASDVVRVWDCRAHAFVAPNLSIPSRS